MKTLLTPTPLIACEEKYLNRVLDDLPDGNYSVIGSVDKGVIDFEVVKTIPTYFHFTRQMTVYQDYNNPNDIDSYYISARNSFISLLESHFLSLDKKYLIIKPC